jgi:hypothetical protein
MKPHRASQKVFHLGRTVLGRKGLPAAIISGASFCVAGVFSGQHCSCWLWRWGRVE